MQAEVRAVMPYWQQNGMTLTWPMQVTICGSVRETGKTAGLPGGNPGWVRPMLMLDKRGGIGYNGKWRAGIRQVSAFVAGKWSGV